MKTTGIYKITNTVNNKYYIGSSIQVEPRLTNHKWRLNNGIHKNPHLQSAWIEYGAEAFEFIVIEACSEEMLLIREDVWMSFYKSRDRECGYNLCTAERHRLSEETKKKMSIAHKGRKATEETKKNMSIAQKGRVVSDECREKLSRINMGKSLSEETKRKISESNMGKTMSKETSLRISESHRGDKHYLFGKHRTEEDINKIKKSTTGEKHWNYGKHYSEELKQKLRESHLGAKLTEEHKYKIGLKSKEAWTRRKIALSQLPPQNSV